MRIITIIAVLLFITGCVKHDELKTIKNLQTAYMDELKDSKTYSLYAKKAKEEGYVDTADQLMNFSKIEHAHAVNHLSILSKIGYQPQLQDLNEDIIIRNTADNIKQLISGESYDINIMYKNFMDTAMKENQHDAFNSFRHVSNTDNDRLIHFKNLIVDQTLWKKNINIIIGLEHQF